MTPVTSSAPDKQVRRAYLAHLVTGMIAVVLFLTGCSTVIPRNPVPEALWPVAEIPEIDRARFWGDRIPPDLEQQIQSLSDDQLQAQFPALFDQPHNYLAISGGGAEGAYGAGILVGWSAAGDRPEFQMVSGVSTGALIAPFVFLGPAYDDVLREVYTTTSTSDILTPRPWLTIPFSDAAAESTPLLALIQRHIDDDAIAAIVAEHRKGRRLFIGTTDLDQMRARIWNIGTIASSGQPGAKELVHKIMLASASIPGAFPPVRIAVEADGQVYHELHVDGGTTTQVFLYPAAIDWRKLLQRLQVDGKAMTYVIRNAKLTPQAKIVPQKLIPIAARSISSLIRSQGRGDLFLIYGLCVRDGVDYNLAYVPESFDEAANEVFDPDYMRTLFDLGYSLGKAGYPWEKTPPEWARAADLRN
jgi:hypothetical protein